MRESRMSGSVGAPGGRLPGATRLFRHGYALMKEYCKASGVQISVVRRRDNRGNVTEPVGGLLVPRAQPAPAERGTAARAAAANRC